MATTPTWRNKPITDDQDSVELDRLVAHHTARGIEPGMAEESAYQDYKKRQHVHAAAFHMHAATEMSRAGHSDGAKKHHALYQMHLAAYGQKHGSKVPDEVVAILPVSGSGTSGFFQSHNADRLVTK